MLSHTFCSIHFKLSQRQVFSVHRRSLKVEACPWRGQDLRFVLMQEHQSAIIRAGAFVCESALSADTCHPQWFVSLCSDAVEEGLLIMNTCAALAVVLGGVSPEGEPSSVIGDDDSGPLFVTVVVESSSGEAVNAGFVDQVESDMTEEREQLPLLISGQAGCDYRHGGGSTVQTDQRMQAHNLISFKFLMSVQSTGEYLEYI